MLREYGLPENYWDTYPEKVMAVTAADVESVARKYVPVDNVVPLRAPPFLVPIQ